MTKLLCFLPLLICLALPARAASLPEDGHSAVIMAYHRVGEDEFPDSNISTGLFLSHIEEIEKGGYHVMALPDLLAAVRRGDTLPPRTIAITFEGAFRSALQNAIPALLKKKIPFTVFYSSGYADESSGPYMTWSDLKHLAEYKGVTFGVLPASYARLADQPEAEIRRQVNKARARHREAFGAEAQYFSYPFGEYSSAYKKIVEGSGFAAAFGLQSGAVAQSSDMFALPRFTMTEKYGDTDRFRTAAETLPFPVHDVVPQATIADTDTPAIGFSVPDALKSSLKSLACFVTGQAPPKVQVLDTRVEIRLAAAIDDRVRVNCTLAGPADPDDDSPTWRWFGMLLATQAGQTGDDNPEDDPIQPPNGLP